MLFRIGIVLLFGLPVGCASGPSPAPGPRPSSPLTQQDLALFDDGVDFVSDPAGLSGGWLQAWKTELDGRLARADVVAIVGIASVSRSEQGQDGRRKFVLSPRTERVVKGNWPDGAPLVSSQGGPGFASLLRGQQRVLEGKYVLFAKWTTAEDGSVLPRWHLSRVGGAVMELMAQRLGVGPERTVVIRRTN
ncbi:MAG: hypothetical protein OXU20_04740 [Myxococcales bacterium]|nr:hypothetical protein [Myxococcales bacterium]MDD9969218.1 hypothetical protein [Myxococcales bacterium]